MGPYGVGLLELAVVTMGLSGWPGAAAGLSVGIDDEVNVAKHPYPSWSRDRPTAEPARQHYDRPRQFPQPVSHLPPRPCAGHVQSLLPRAYVRNDTAMMRRAQSHRPAHPLGRRTRGSGWAPWHAVVPRVLRVNQRYRGAPAGRCVSVQTCARRRTRKGSHGEHRKPRRLSVPPTQHDPTPKRSRDPTGA